MFSGYTVLKLRELARTKLSWAKTCAIHACTYFIHTLNHFGLENIAQACITDIQSRLKLVKWLKCVRKILQQTVNQACTKSLYIYACQAFCYVCILLPLTIQSVLVNTLS
ncbi:hypothetical protein Zmor_010862 [Zophobas morio]|uniref:Uncharacterized protein n=1 Tax=Zophobas morio TaxID=2755281 RepID=A0AA38IJL3_9CUCU|nr:hypothetical protein Zmor_010862 [Zophobas morio]